MVAVLNRVTQAGAQRVTESAVPRITEGDRPAIGTAAITLASISLVATGNVYSSLSSGTLGATLAPLTLAATGTVANQIVSGTLNATLGTLALSASGTVTQTVRVATLNVTLADLGLYGHGHTFRPWTTEARRHQLWARETPPIAIDIWTIEPRASGNWTKERIARTGASNRRQTERGDRRVTEASDIRVLELGQVWFNQPASPVDIWTKEKIQWS